MYKIHGNTKHGLSYSKEYKIWCSIKDRCCNIKCKAYSDYGARGISVCDRWLDKEKGFQNFYQDMGDKPGKEYSIERRDNNGNYEPDNCCWGTRKEQNNNSRHNNNITWNGRTSTLSQWSEILNINYKVLSNRINKHKWSIEKAFLTPYIKGRKRLKYENN